MRLGIHSVSYVFAPFFEAESLVQDFLAIGAHACKNVLQALLRDKTILKVCDASHTCNLYYCDMPVASSAAAHQAGPSLSLIQVGFGVLMDLKAIATAIGGEGAGTVAVVQPYIDIKGLHRQLSISSTPGIKKVTCKPAPGNSCHCQVSTHQPAASSVWLKAHSSKAGGRRVCTDEWTWTWTSCMLQHSCIRHSHDRA